MSRTVLVSLLVIGFPLVAAADDLAPAAAAATAPAHQARLVGVMLSTAQALLWDDERGEYVLHRVGDEALGGRLVELDADHIVIERGEARDVLEMTAPPQMRVAGKRAPKRMPAMVISAVPEPSEKVAAAAPAPVAAPAATPAPIAAPATVIATSPAPSPVATAPVANQVTPSAPPTAPVASALTPDRRPAAAAMIIPRGDFDRALGDFAALSQDIQVTPQPEGGFRLTAVRSGSFFERIGLRSNDVVLRVDGRPINGVEDASAAYAWLRVADRFTVDVLRDGRPLTLQYVIAQPLTASAQ